MQLYQEHLNARKAYKEARLKATNGLEDVLSTRYDYSFKALLQDLEVVKGIRLAQILIHKLSPVTMDMQQLAIVLSESGVHNTVTDAVKLHHDLDDVSAKLVAIAEQYHEKGVKYITTDSDVAKLFHDYERFKLNEQMVKVQMNSTYSNSTHGKFGA